MTPAGPWLLPFAVLVPLGAAAQNPRAVLPAPDAVARLRAAVAEALRDPSLRHARLGVRIEDPDLDAPLVDHLGDRGFMTASNMKLFSSAVALLVLGPDFRYETRLVAAGKVTGGVLYGDLILVGSGDPTFGARAFEKEGCTAPLVRFAAALRAAGIREIAGRVIGDDSVHPDEIMGRGWDWSYHADWYAAQVSGLCFNENCIDLILDGTRVGEPPRITLDPPTSYVRVVNRVRCVERGPAEVSFTRPLGGDVITLSGTFVVERRGVRDWGSVPNPTRFAATVLRETLLREGIEVWGGAYDLDEVRRAPPAPRRVIAVHRSPPLSSILVSLNKRSQNLYAEQVIRTAARVRLGDGSFAAARRVLVETLTDLGVDCDGFEPADGSGLSRLNLAQPRQICALLAGMLRTDHGKLFLETLPVAGIDGTLRKRFPEGSPARGRVRAKTGYIARVVALSGYVPRRDRAPLVFSILANDFVAKTSEVKRVVDRLVDGLTALAGP